MEKQYSANFDLQSFLKCPKCKIVIDNPYESTCCGTLFCCTCSKYSAGEKCQKCNKIYHFRQNCFVKRISNSMMLNCGFNCGNKYQLSDIRDHMLSCELREYICHICNEINMRNKNNKIYFQGNKEQLLSHILINHSDEVLKYNDNYMEIKCSNNNAEEIKKMGESPRIYSESVSYEGEFSSDYYENQ